MFISERYFSEIMSYTIDVFVRKVRVKKAFP